MSLSEPLGYRPAIAAHPDIQIDLSPAHGHDAPETVLVLLPTGHFRLDPSSSIEATLFELFSGAARAEFVATDLGLVLVGV